MRTWLCKQAALADAPHHHIIKGSPALHRSLSAGRVHPLQREREGGRRGERRCRVEGGRAALAMPRSPAVQPRKLPAKAVPGEFPFAV